MKEYIQKILLFNGGDAGMADDLFFHKIYFWMFFGFVLYAYAVVYETSRLFRAIFFGLITVVFGATAYYVPELGPHFLIWSLFAIVLIVYAIQDKRRAARNAFLFVVSLFFYYKTSGFFFLILVFSTLVDYTLGMGIYHSKKQRMRLLFVTLSVMINLLLLGYFKYAYFFTNSFNELAMSLNQMIGSAFFSADHEVVNYLALWTNNVWGSSFRVSQIILPVGISFYTFQTISYSVDVYKKKVKPVYNLLDFGFYVSFFPQLVAGPIVRAADFVPQLYKDYKLTKYKFGLGLFWILNGLLKKAFLADFIANGFVDGVFASPSRFSGFENIMAVFGYSLQVYADFSGYTDIAIGIALLLGFRLNTNFNSPYKARNVGEFWKRWHISLSTWLKDYLYIPLGGNKKGSKATYITFAAISVVIVLLSGSNWWIALSIIGGVVIVFFILSLIFPDIKGWINTNINLMITMVLGGLWHGSSWNFVIWGALNGFGLVVYKLWRKISPWENWSGRLAHIWKIAVTLTFITFTRIFFRSADFEIASEMISQIKGNMVLAIIPSVVSAFWLYYGVMVLGYWIHWLPQSFKMRYRHWFIKSHVSVKVLAVVAAVIIAYQSLVGAQPFIYFQF